MLKYSKQSIRRNERMTAPFMAVGTEDSIHDGAALMRRTAHVSSYEYDIVLSVPASERLHTIGHAAPEVDNWVHNENAFFFWQRKGAQSAY